MRWPLIEASYYQIDLLRQKPNRFLNLVYAWAIERVPSDKVEDWLVELAEPLEWQSLDSTYVENLESDSFMAAMAQQ